LQTRVVNKRFQEYDVYIGRGSKWGNPYTHIKGKTKAQFLVESREKAVEEYKDWILEQPKLMADLQELKGKTLGCWCKPKACHGDILSELANSL